MHVHLPGLQRCCLGHTCCLARYEGHESAGFSCGPPTHSTMRWSPLIYGLNKHLQQSILKGPHEESLLLLGLPKLLPPCSSCHRVGARLKEIALHAALRAGAPTNDGKGCCTQGGPGFYPIPLSWGHTDLENTKLSCCCFFFDEKVSLHC